MQFEESTIILAFDFGLKRIGVAVGQTLTKSATPLKTIFANQGIPDWNDVARLLKKWRPGLIIVGLPLNMDGTEQPMSHSARLFAKALAEKYKIQVIEVDERLTTKEAKARLFETGGFKALQDGQVDQVAAQLILQNWFSSQSNK